MAGLFNNTIYTSTSASNKIEQKRQEMLKAYDINYNAFYRGYVVDNNDPLKLGRVRVRVPSIHGIYTDSDNYVPNSMIPWASSGIFNGAANDSGQYLVPDVGSVVFTTYEYDNQAFPIYFGGIVSKHGSSSKNLSSLNINQNNKYEVNDDDLIKDIVHGTERVIYKSLKGATIMLDDYDGQEYIKIIDQSGQTISLENYSDKLLLRRGNELAVNNKSKITITNNQGDKIVLKDDEIFLKSRKINIETEEIRMPGKDVDFASTSYFEEEHILDDIIGKVITEEENHHDSIFDYHRLADIITGYYESESSRYNQEIIKTSVKFLDDNFKNTFINASSIYTNYEDRLIELCLNSAEYILSI